jgi:predicted O-linked N-acetylglucosamine transferase (SPINDLY family)
MHICDWQDFDANAKNLLLKISEGKKSSPSFPILALTDSLSIQHKTAEIWINDNHPFNPSLGIISKLPRKEKIKLAFLSADFKEHPTGYNFVGFFENIDRDKFEVIAVSFLNITDSPLSRRLAAAFDVFKIVDKLSDTEVCKWVLDQKIDIAIDMMGPTLGNRGGILAMRCAPIQVNQFSWTSGAPYIDYIIADPISMPKEYAEAYSEKLAYVPHTLFATDDKREISIKTPLRSEQDLPEKGIVFCCLNNNFKITPHVFDSWINILKNVPDSVLWIKGGHESMERNLRGEVALRGVDTSRLVFAKHTALMQDHLARYGLADLFLDTFPFCAQTTASDALWAGVPVLTRVGESSMSRICASLLNAIELPELITKTQSEYEATAIELATNPVKLNAIKDKLARNRLTTALFDTPKFTKNIEAAYMQMYEHYQADLTLDHIYIDALE